MIFQCRHGTGAASIDFPAHTVGQRHHWDKLGSIRLVTEVLIPRQCFAWECPSGWDWRLGAPTGRQSLSLRAPEPGRASGAPCYFSTRRRGVGIKLTVGKNNLIFSKIFVCSLEAGKKNPVIRTPELDGKPVLGLYYMIDVLFCSIINLASTQQFRNYRTGSTFPTCGCEWVDT